MLIIFSDLGDGYSGCDGNEIQFVVGFGVMVVVILVVGGKVVMEVAMVVVDGMAWDMGVF